jgi:hypothetical protein
MIPSFLSERRVILSPQRRSQTGLTSRIAGIVTRALIRPTFVLTLILACTLSTQSCGQDGDFEKRIRDTTKEAEQARAEADYEKVEQLRLARWDIAKEWEAASPKSTSIWVLAFRTLREIDGEADAIRPNKKSPGMVNQLRYKDAARKLRDAWKEIVASSDDDESLPGEVAVRFSEVAQQAVSCYRDALDEESENLVATKDEIISCLESAAGRDPCCLLALPMLQYLKPASQEEVFLRAEARPDFSSRQQSLVAISHPLITPASGQQAEQDHIPVMPWHAPAEFAKANNLKQLLQDLDYADLLRQSWVQISGGQVQYIIPGHILKGRDALGQPFEFYYGRYFICQVEDADGQLRTAFLFINEKNCWEHRFLELLWRTPTREELDAEPTLREKQILMESLPVKAAWKMDGLDYSIREYPVYGTEKLIRFFMQQFCIKDSEKLTRMKASPTRNDQAALLKLEGERQKVLFTTARLKTALLKLKNTNDITKHPLVEVLRQRKQAEWSDVELAAKPDEDSPQASPFNPLLLVVDGDRREICPEFFQEEGGRPYLRLDNGQELTFDLGDDEGSPRCSVAYPGVTAYMPLSYRAVPLIAVTASPMGGAFFNLLIKAGYSQADAIQELRKCLDNRFYIPSNFEKQIRIRVASRAKSKGSMDYASELAEMLKEGGWGGEGITGSPPVFAAEIDAVYFVYGFTYLRDSRRNWIYNRGLHYPLAIDDAAGRGPDRSLLIDYPWEFRAPDGKGRIEASQIYSWDAYEQIDNNILDEHLVKCIAYHPCFAGLETYRAQLEKMRIHPVDQRPAYLEQFESTKKQNKRPDSNSGDLSLSHAVARWVCIKDDQDATLNNLHNGYRERVLKSIFANAGVVSQLRDLAKMRESPTAVVESIASAEKQYSESVNAYEKATLPLIALQLESARYYARQAFFHRSVVYYNDLLSQLYARVDSNPFAMLLRDSSSVATTDSARRFASGVESWVLGQRLLLTVQLELGGVLHAAGLHESARQLWQAVIDGDELLVQPAIKQAQVFTESYGLRLGEQARKAAGYTHDTALLAKEALDRRRLGVKWRAVPKLQPAELADIRADLKTVRGCMETQALKGLGGLAATDKRDLEQAIERITKSKSLDFATWLEVKKMLSSRPALALRCAAPISPARACPFKYAGEANGAGLTGFVQQPIEAVVADADAKRILDWCGGRAEPGADDTDVESCYLVGWYWVDVDDKPRARDAFMALARALRVRAARQKDLAKQMTDELSAFHAILYASSVIQSLPGARGLKTDFTRALSLPLAFWEQKWFAGGQYGPHGSGARQKAETLASEIQALISQDAAAWRSDRYYFPDYACQLGTVPDFLVHEAIESPNLFKKLEPGGEELAEKGAAASDEDDWALIKPEEVTSFFENLRVNEEVEEDVVFLGDNN